MDEDLYTALIGSAPTDLQQQKALAEQLRRRRSFGELGALTGDRVLQPFGQTMMKDADADVASLQQNRQMDTDNAQTKAYQDSQIGHMGEVLAETKRGNNLDFTARMAQIQAMIDTANIKADKPGSYRKMTDNTRNKMLAQVDAYTGVDDLLEGFDDNYTQQLGAGPQSAIPNALATVGIGTAKSKAAQKWWADWNEIRTLPERNRLFGQTLTPNEQASWAKIDLHPGMSPTQIREGMRRIQRIIKNSARNRMRGMQGEGFDPEALGEYYMDLLPDGADTELDDPTQGEIQREHYVPPRPGAGHSSIQRVREQGPVYRIKTDANGNPIVE